MLNEKFLALLTKELANEISPEERAELDHLLAVDPTFKKEYKIYKAYWQNKDHAYTDDALAFVKVKARIKAMEGLHDMPGAENRPQRSFFGRYWLRVAAILVLSFTSATIYYYQRLNKPAAIAWQHKKTATGTKSSITLSDGTLVILNANSQFKFPTTFKGRKREVYLTGEAYFEVHKDQKHPFIIHTRKMNIRVLGTAFNVKAYPNDAQSETTLIHGSVEVTLNDRPSDRIILKPDEKLVINNRAVLTRNAPSKSKAAVPTQYRLTTLSYFNQNDTTAIETSWTQNKLVVKNSPFDDLAAQMERRYGYEIRFKNEKLKALRFTASFEKENIKQVLEALRFTEDFHYDISASTISIY